MNIAGKPNSNITTGDSAELKQFIYQLVGAWHWIAITLIIFLLAAFAYNKYTEPVFMATTSVMIKDDKKGGGAALDNPILADLQIASTGKLIENEIEVLQSFDLMESVVRKLQLFVDMRSKGKIASRMSYGNTQPINIRIANPDTVQQSLEWGLEYDHISKNCLLTHSANSKPLHITLGKWYIINGLLFQIFDNPYFQKTGALATGERTKSDLLLNIYPLRKTVQSYLNALSVQPVSKSASIINLSLKAPNDVKAQDALSTLINIYVQQGVEDKNLINKNTLNFLDERLSIVEQELRGVEGRVEKYRSNQKVTDVNAEGHLVLEQARLVDGQKAEQLTQLNILESVESRLQSNQNLPSGSVINEPLLTNLFSSYNELILTKERQSERLGPKNPILIDLENQITNTKQSILGNISTLKQAYKINLSDISGKEAELNSKMRSLPGVEKNLVQIKRDQSVKEQLYFLLLQKREESAIALASTAPDSRNVEKPRSIGVVSPKKTLIFAISFFFGIAIPIGIIYLINFLDTKLSGKEEVEQKCTAPVLGEISFAKKGDSAVVVQKGSRSVIAEQFRVIRTNIGFTRSNQTSKIILVTSHRPEEGKSFTSLNLAASYALLNKKVVVLEFDLRKPRLSSTLNIKSSMGISNYLSSENVKIEDCLIDVPGFDKNFWLISAGPIPPNPAELILSDRMKTFIEDIKKKFDYIILDTPPFSLVTDSSLLASHADLSLIVLRQGFTFKWVLNEINKKRADSPNEPIYTVINRVGERGYYKNYRQYGYSEYFDNPEKPTWKQRLFGRKRN